MNDLKACVRLCERGGFPGPAAALRSFAAGRVPLFLVRCQIDPETAERQGFDPDDFRAARKLFFDQGRAERHRRELIRRAIRNLRRTEHDRNPSDLPIQGYRREVRAIFGAHHATPPRVGDRLIPDSATDDQIARLAGYFLTSLFDVVELGGQPGCGGYGN